MTDKNKPFSLKERKRSFIYAFAGLKTFFRAEHNSWIHLTAAIVVIVLGKILDIDNYEWCWIILAIGLVIMTELFNTAIESLTDMVSPNYNDLAKKVKDLSAAAVLIASLTALTIGLIVFLPKLLFIKML